MFIFELKIEFFFLKKINRRNSNKINNSFKFNNNIKPGITALAIFAPVALINRKQLKTILDLACECCIKTLENDISHKNLDMLKNKRNEFIMNKKFLFETGATLYVLKKGLKKKALNFIKFLLKACKK